MQILMAGIDHSTASVEIREQFSFTAAEKADFLEQLPHTLPIDGCVLLSTCNRTELWVSCAEGTVPSLISAICQYKLLKPWDYSSFFFEKSNTDAVSYLFEMTSGLHSQILGEDQILAQVKKALDDARTAGTCGSVLEVLFRSAVTGAKKVKTQLSLSTANASAVELAIAHFSELGMSLAGKRCLVIGNGEMGKRAATALLSRNADVTVTIRQYHSGIVEVVPGCRRINYADRYAYIPDCDLVVSATSSPNTTIQSEQLRQIPRKAELCLLDLAVPRDIDPAVKTLPGVTLWDIDSFSVPPTEELIHQLAEAKTLLGEQQTKFLNWLECREDLPLLHALSARFAEDTLFRMGAALRTLPQPQRDTLTDAARDACRKELEKQLFRIRDEAGAEAFHRIVNLLNQQKGENAL